MEKSMKEQLVAEIAGREEYWSPDERGRDWFDLTDADIEIFQIAIARWADLAAT